jgi:hypothetical protein
MIAIRFGLLLLLVACTQQQQVNTDINTALAKLASVTISDLNAAAADAQAHGDVLAVACYPVLANWVISLQQQAHGQPLVPSGAFSAFQAGRDVYKNFSGAAGGGLAAVPNSVKLGCSALYLDAKGDVLSFITLLTRIASGTFVPPLPPLP